MSIQSPALSDHEVSRSRLKQRSNGPPTPDIAVQFATVADWVTISGMRRTKTYEAMGRGDLRAIKLDGRTLIDVPHGLTYLRSLPPAVINTGRKPQSR